MKSPTELSLSRIDRHQVPMPAALAVRSKEGNDIDEVALARGASTRSSARFVIPVVDIDAPTFEEVEQMSAIGTCVLLYERAQYVSLLPLDRRKVLMRGP